MRLKNSRLQPQHKQKLLANAFAADTEAAASSVKPMGEIEKDDDGYQSVAPLLRPQSGNRLCQSFCQRKMRLLIVLIFIWLLIFLGTLLHGMHCLRPVTVSETPQDDDQRPSPAPKPIIMRIPIVEDSVDENGKMVTKVVYSTTPGANSMNTVITCLLIGAAVTYLVVMVAYICFKKRRHGSGSLSDNVSTDDENYVSYSECTTSSYPYDQTQTSTSRSLQDQRYDGKDTMSNSSVSQDYPLQMDVKQNSARANLISEKRIRHQRNVTKLIFNQSIAETESDYSQQQEVASVKGHLVIDTNLSDASPRCNSKISPNSQDAMVADFQRLAPPKTTKNQNLHSSSRVFFRSGPDLLNLAEMQSQSRNNQ